MRQRDVQNILSPVRLDQFNAGAQYLMAIGEYVGGKVDIPSCNRLSGEAAVIYRG